MSEKEVKEVLKGADLNRDGRLNYKEVNFQKHKKLCNLIRTYN